MIYLLISSFLDSNDLSKSPTFQKSRAFFVSQIKISVIFLFNAMFNSELELNFNR